MSFVTKLAGMSLRECGVMSIIVVICDLSGFYICLLFLNGYNLKSKYMRNSQCRDRDKFVFFWCVLGYVRLPDLTTGA